MSVFRRDEARGMGPTIPCACGCGATMPMYDDRKRPREYVRGHHVRAAWQAVKKAATLKGDPL